MVVLYPSKILKNPRPNRWYVDPPKPPKDRSFYNPLWPKGGQESGPTHGPRGRFGAPTKTPAGVWGGGRPPSGRPRGGREVTAGPQPLEGALSAAALPAAGEVRERGGDRRPRGPEALPGAAPSCSRTGGGGRGPTDLSPTPRPLAEPQQSCG